MFYSCGCLINFHIWNLYFNKNYLVSKKCSTVKMQWCFKNQNEIKTKIKFKKIYENGFHVMSFWTILSTNKLVSFFFLSFFLFGLKSIIFCLIEKWKKLFGFWTVKQANHFSVNRHKYSYSKDILPTGQFGATSSDPMRSIQRNENGLVPRRHGP